MNPDLHSDESEYDSEEDQQHLRYQQILENMPLRANVDKADEEEEATLKPRLAPTQKPALKNNSMAVMRNDSKVTVTSRKNLQNAYTFKIGGVVPRKKHDPVSLYQRTSQSWKSDRFLKSKANNK